jgi:hypothetical protein
MTHVGSLERLPQGHEGAPVLAKRVQGQLLHDRKLNEPPYEADLPGFANPPLELGERGQAIPGGRMRAQAAKA